MKVKIQETHLTGIAISQGIAIGIPFFFAVIEDSIPEKHVPEEALEGEIDRFRKAVNRCRLDIQKLQAQLEMENAIEAVAILDTHIHIMSDPLLNENVEQEIRNRRKNADFIFKELSLRYQEKFKAMPDAFFRERVLDLQDIGRRIIAYLCEQQHVSLSEIPEGSIVFSRDLAASDVAEVKGSAVLAFVTETGGATSHAAIVAKAKGIPYIASVDFGLIEQVTPEMAIVDGNKGVIILNPAISTLEMYEGRKQEQNQFYHALEKTSFLQPETVDGHQMRLSANIEMVNEIEMVHRYGAGGVGLFRSEYLFLSQQDFPSEEEQFAIYKSIVKKMNGLPIVIRTFDVGGDKLMPQQQASYKRNPYLGCRAIRFLLQEKEIFKTQLRAILRASIYGNVKIMFPMVIGISELLEAKKMVEESKQELKKSGKKVPEKIKIGCMIEVPSAAVVADLLAQECDFLSIGTNDLVQYTLAADRGNQSSSVQYLPTHPAVIRLIKLVVTHANRFGIPVAVCGEIAADPKFTPLLMGLGISELSVTSRSLPIIKNAIRNVSILEVSQLADRILTLKTPEEVEECLLAYPNSII